MSRLTSRWLLFLCLASALACRRMTPSNRAVAFDPQLVDREPGRFLQTFDGSPSRLVLGTGWYGAEHGGKDTPWANASWAASRATVYFGVPLAGEVDFLARATRFSYPGAPPQMMDLILNGHALPAVAVGDGFNEIRLPLPSVFLRRPINEIELGFAYTTQPAHVSKSPDSRELSAVFNALAVVPKGEPLLEASSQARPENGRLLATLRDGGLSIPLPAGSRGRVLFGQVEASDSPIRVEVQRAASPTTPLWSGPAKGLSGRSLAFSGGGRAASTLLVRPSSVESGISLELNAPEAVMERRPPAGGSTAPNIFLYVIDTLRADEIGAYGSGKTLSPRIDAFARDAVTYERAWSASSWTLPATVSILSGLYPFAHGARQVGDAVPPSGISWLPEDLRRRGYETAGFSQWPLGRLFGVNRGFENFTLDMRLASKTRAEFTRGLFWQYISGRIDPARSLFAYVHVSDPHAVYSPRGTDRELADREPGRLVPLLYNPQVFMAEGFGADPANRAHLRALYEGEVQYSDRQFGAFLDLLRYLGLYDRSLIILVADHGEEFYEHGGFDHGRTLYEELLHVPLIVKYPDGQAAGARVRTRVSTLDIPPTVLRWLNRPAGDSRFHGRVLPRREDGGETDREVFAETQVEAGPVQGPVDLLAVASGSLKCILNKLSKDRFYKQSHALEAYDLAVDPQERSPLPASDPRFARCRDMVSRWLTRASEAARESGKPETLLPEEVRRLRSLGYLH